MPFVCALVYLDQWWLAFVLAVLIGCTDFVDGYLARRHGPTVLGGLMDPIADKVFIAFAYLPFVDLGYFPAWPIILLFVREFVVTGLRTAYERRALHLRTSYLAKVKTWVQMQGLGLALLFIMLDAHRGALLGIVVAAVAAPLIALGVFWAVRRRLWPGALIMAAASLPLAPLYAHGDPVLAVEVVLYIVVAITWISGLDYLVLGLREIRGRGRLDTADAMRLAGALALPCLVLVALVETSATIAPLVAILALELAVGGLDNLLAHQRQSAGAVAWGLRAFGTSALIALALALEARWLIYVAAVASLGGVGWEFWRGRDYYLDARLRKTAPLRNLEAGRIKA